MGIVIIVCVLVLAMLLAAWLATRQRHVLNRRDAALYREAAKIFDRVLNLSTLDAGITEDVLSPTTRKQMESWLSQYRKELDK